jgi:flagellin-like hook-associated protein FlgL
MMFLAGVTVLQQATISMLAQANQNRGMITQLLEAVPV